MRALGNKFWTKGIGENASGLVLPGRRKYTNSSIVRALPLWSYENLKPASLRALIEEIEGVPRCLDGCWVVPSAARNSCTVK